MNNNNKKGGGKKKTKKHQNPQASGMTNTNLVLESKLGFNSKKWWSDFCEQQETNTLK